MTRTEMLVASLEASRHYHGIARGAFTASLAVFLECIEAHGGKPFTLLQIEAAPRLYAQTYGDTEGVLRAVAPARVRALAE